MSIVAIIAAVLFVILWAGGAIHLLPFNLHSADNGRYVERAGATVVTRRYFIKKEGRLYRGRYSLWHPVVEIIPYVLYVSTKQPFYLDDFGFERGR